jgi:hypothetical protein
MTFSVGCWGVGTYTQYTKATSVFVTSQVVEGPKVMQIKI